MLLWDVIKQNKMLQTHATESKQLVLRSHDIFCVWNYVSYLEEEKVYSKYLE